MRHLAIALVLGLAGCGTELPGVPTQHTPLRAALARVAATDVTRRHVEYADIQAIEAVTADGPWQELGHHRRGALGVHRGSLSDLMGIDLFLARQRISAGDDDSEVELFVGGQNAARVDALLRAAGWRDRGDELAAPDPSTVDSRSGVLAIIDPLAKVRPNGDDVARAGKEASLAAVLRPGTTTLADDPVLSQLADCLGDVMAATFSGHQREGLLYHGAGVRRTTDKAGTPQMLICSKWSSDDRADDAAERQIEALETPRFAGAYRNSRVERLDGDLVRLTADAPTNPAAVFYDISPKQLPGLLETG